MNKSISQVVNETLAHLDEPTLLERADAELKSIENYAEFAEARKCFSDVGCYRRWGTLIKDLRDELSRYEAENARLREALEDMLSGWKYIREVHGDLCGVGWDRAQDKAEQALKETE